VEAVQVAVATVVQVAVGTVILDTSYHKINIKT